MRTERCVGCLRANPSPVLHTVPPDWRRFVNTRMIPSKMIIICPECREKLA